MLIERNVRPAIIERAFEIAGLGEIKDVAELTRCLNREGYEMASAHLSGPTIRAQIKAALRGGKTCLAAKLEEQPAAGIEAARWDMVRRRIVRPSGCVHTGHDKGAAMTENRSKSRDSEQEDLKPGQPPRPKTEPDGSEDSSLTNKTKSGPATGVPTQ